VTEIAPGGGWGKEEHEGGEKGQMWIHVVCFVGVRVWVRSEDLVGR
jgi:hypothetical protein